MECSCVRHTDVPGTSKLFADLIYHFDRVAEFYPWRPNDTESLRAAAQFDYPNDRRAALVRALTPLNHGNPSLDELARPGTVAIVTGQQVGLFSGPAYSIYKALTAIKAARELCLRGVPAVPVFWLATEDHDFAEVDHAWVFGTDHQPLKLQAGAEADTGSQPVGGIHMRDLPIAELRRALSGFPYEEEAVSLVEQAYKPGETMGNAFARFVQKLLKPYGLLLVDPLTPALREIAAPILSEAVLHMPELSSALIERSKQLVERGYHAQVLVEKTTSLVFVLEKGRRVAVRRTESHFTAGQGVRLSPEELAARGTALSPNALLRPVVQDYLLPTAAYIGGPAELAYLAQSQVLYGPLLGRQPVTFPRAFFTIVDERLHKRMRRYGLSPTDLFRDERDLHASISGRLIPDRLRHRLEDTKSAFNSALDSLKTDLDRFDVSLASGLETSRKKIEYQLGKVVRRTGAQMMRRDEQAERDARLLSGLVFPQKHLQERFYSIVPFLAKFGPGIVDDLLEAVRIECPDHQFVIA